MRVLIFGLPGSGKTMLATQLIACMPCLYLNGDAVRGLFQDKDFTAQGRINQALRMRVLADMAQEVVVIADFVCPTEKTRKIFAPQLSIWMNTVADCAYADTSVLFEKPVRVDIEISQKDAENHVPMILERIKELKVYA